MADDLGVPRLTDEQILTGKGGAELDQLNKRQRDELVAKTPLWFYVLREAEINDGMLDGVGARILAETFHRSLESSRTSIVGDGGWKPNLGSTPGAFTMADLLMFAFDRDRHQLAPLD